MARSAIVQAGLNGIRPDPTDIKDRMDQLRQRMPQGCIREVDVDATIKAKRTTYKDGSTL